MKTLILWMLVLTIASVSNAQNVNIPDTAFLSALIRQGVDKDNDGEISYAEAANVTNLEVWYYYLIDMTGIEAFINLDSLICLNTGITVLDLSNNQNLKYLACQGKHDYCLPMPQSINGILSHLNISNNLLLTTLVYKYQKSLTTLDISNNSALDKIDISYNPNLSTVYVWTWPFPPEDVEVSTGDSPNVQFTTECPTKIKGDYKEHSTIDIFPNPSDDIINIETGNINNAAIEIYNVNGRLVFSKELNSKVEKIDVSGFPKGIYVVKVIQANTFYVGKVVVR